MKGALKLVNDKSSNMVSCQQERCRQLRAAQRHPVPLQCIYIICICILLGVASVALKLSGKV